MLAMRLCYLTCVVMKFTLITLVGASAVVPIIETEDNPVWKDVPSPMHTKLSLINPEIISETPTTIDLKSPNNEAGTLSRVSSGSSEYSTEFWSLSQDGDDLDETDTEADDVTMREFGFLEGDVADMTTSP